MPDIPFKPGNGSAPTSRRVRGSVFSFDGFCVFHVVEKLFVNSDMRGMINHLGFWGKKLSE